MALLPFSGAPTKIKVDTEANILALTPSSGKAAYGTDTQFFYVADGTNWRRASLKFYTDSANPDMGVEQNNAKDGYYATFITDKGLFNVYIGTNPSTNEGGIWFDNTVSPKLLKVYSDGAEKTVMIDFTNETGELVHEPFAVGEPIRVRNGMSVAIGLNGRPIYNEYAISMGAYPPARGLNGGGA